MATRRDIREAFYARLESAANPHVPAENITQESPGSKEELPTIVHNDDYRKIPINQGSGAPSEIEYDSNGDATAEVYETLHEASFGLGFIDHDEQRKEDSYEAVRSYFEKFETVGWDVESIHSDAEIIRVLDSHSEDDEDASPTIRGDRLIVRIQFTREHVKDIDPTTSVNRIGDTA